VLHGRAVEHAREVVQQRVDEQRARLSRSYQHTLRRARRTHVFDEEDGAPADLRAEVLDRKLRPVLLHTGVLQEHVVRESGPLPDARDLLARGVELHAVSARGPIAGVGAPAGSARRARP
jgi:hypothetical protein